MVSRRLKYYVRLHYFWWCKVPGVQLAWWYLHNKRWLQWHCSDCREFNRYHLVGGEFVHKKTGEPWPHESKKLS